MKKILLLIAFCCAGLFQSCTDFLNLTPRNTKVVSDVEDYRDIMASYLHMVSQVNPQHRMVFGGDYIYPPFSELAEYLGYYTGEINLPKDSYYYYDVDAGILNDRGRNILTWHMYDATIETTWDRGLKFIGALSLVISGVETANGNDEMLRQRIKGEALTWRAYMFYKLVQHYSPYSEGNQYGIPISLDPVSDIGTHQPERNTIKETYEQIIGDCKAALALLETSPATPWNVAYDKAFVHSLLASVYHFKAMSVAKESTDWSNAEVNATAAMVGRSLTPSASAVAKLKEIFNCNPAKAMTDDEFTLRLADGSNNQLCNVTCYSGKAVPQFITDAFEYKDIDVRHKAFVAGSALAKYNSPTVYKGGVIMPFRLADMVLIKAEAQVRNGKTQQATETLKEYRDSRYTSAVPMPTDPIKLLDAILQERQLEFFAEIDMRWLEMKRLGVRLSREIDGVENVLTPNDFRYTLPIPQRELRLNKNMKQNPGWEGYVPR